MKQDKLFKEQGIGNAIILVDDSLSLGLIFKTEGTDGDIQVPIKKRRTQNTLSVDALKIELLEAGLSVEGTKSVLRMRLESSKLDNFEMTEKLVYSLKVEQLRLYCVKHDLSSDGKKADLIARLLNVPAQTPQDQSSFPLIASSVGQFIESN